MGGSSPAEGRVEVTHIKYGHGTVCDNSWDVKDACVVCQMLGYGAAKRAPGRAYFGQGTGRILLTQVDCTGRETNIDECEHGGWMQRGCRTHRRDAGAVCYQSKQINHYKYLFFHSYKSNHVCQVSRIWRSRPS